MARKPRFLNSAVFDHEGLPGAGLPESGFKSGHVPAKHKWSSDAAPYTVANEYICGEIGRFIHLPIPPFAITQHKHVPHQFIFSSLDFNYEHQDLEPVIPEKCIEHLLLLCTGVLAFDVLIANCDRHIENLAVDNIDRPRQMQVFDHNVALFGSLPREGINRLTTMRSRLGITGSTVTQGNRHIFLSLLPSNEHFDMWITRINTIPHWFIDAVCQDARSYGITNDEARAAADFLNGRKWDMRGIINRHNSEFKAISPWMSL